MFCVKNNVMGTKIFIQFDNVGKMKTAYYPQDKYQVIFPGIFATFLDFFLSVLAGNCTAGFCNVLQAIHENVRES